MRNVDDLLSIAVYTRDRVNPYLFNYALSVALLHRPDTQNLDLPSFIRSFPDKYVDGKIFAKAREEAHIVPDGSRVRHQLEYYIFFILTLVFVTIIIYCIVFRCQLKFLKTLPHPT